MAEGQESPVPEARTDEDATFKPSSLDELLSYETPKNVFDPDLIRYPTFGICLYVRGLANPLEISDLQQETRMVQSNQPLRDQMAQAMGVQRDQLRDDWIGYIVWAARCAQTAEKKQLNRLQMARLAVRTGAMVQEIATRAMLKSGVMGLQVEVAKNNSAGAG